jgi:hypothetical protein
MYKRPLIPHKLLWSVSVHVAGVVPHLVGTAWAQRGQSVGTAWAQRGHSVGTALAQRGHSLGTAWAQPGHSLGIAWAQRVLLVLALPQIQLIVLRLPEAEPEHGAVLVLVVIIPAWGTRPLTAAVCCAGGDQCSGPSEGDGGEPEGER